MMEKPTSWKYYVPDFYQSEDFPENIHAPNGVVMCASSAATIAAEHMWDTSHDWKKTDMPDVLVIIDPYGKKTKWRIRTKTITDYYATEIDE